jgi:hypothetical protein
MLRAFNRGTGLHSNLRISVAVLKVQFRHSATRKESNLEDHLHAAAAALDDLISRAAERGITDPEALAEEIYETGDEALLHFVVSLGLQALTEQASSRGGTNE